jgi:hypothetical protein
MTDIYQPPSADMEERTQRFRGGGSLEDAIAGRYQFSIGAIFDEAWRQVSGKKGTCWIACIMYFAVVMVFSFVLDFVLGRMGLHSDGLSSKLLAQPPGDVMHQSFASAASSIIELFVTVPLSAGLFMLGLKLVVRAPVEVTEIFQHFDKVLALVGTTLLMYLMIFIGLCFFILPGIYLMLAYTQAIALVVEKGLKPWEALEASRKAMTHHWFGFLGLYFLAGLLMLVSALPLFIGLIWTLPFSLLLNGVVYRTVFGYEGETLVEQAAGA